MADTSANLDGHWASLDRGRADVDLVGYLVEQRIRYAFPSELSGDGIQTEADSTDVYIAMEGQRAELLDGADVQKTLGICQTAVRPINSYRIGPQCYLIVEYRWDEYDVFQAILVLPVERLAEAHRKLNELIQKARSLD